MEESAIPKNSTKLRLMATHVVDHVRALFFERMRREAGNISEKQIEHAFQKEKIFIFPGKNKTKRTTIRDMASHLYRCLSFNNALTEETMLLRWSRFVDSTFTSNDCGGVASCQIM